MKSFLEHVAEDIINKYGTDLSHIAIVFPNKRASLFLNDYLAHLAGKPLWSPVYMTISELFRQHTERVVADPIKLVCDLHKSFVRQTGINQTLDHFYGWGQLMLADFDDIDKNMADADKVFANLRDIHELDDVSYLSDEQKSVIRRFFSNFSDDHHTKLKERFLSLWSHMGDIYHDFNQQLQLQNLAYEGALYRQVADSDITFPYDIYLFVGFNMIQRVEQRLFTILKQQGKAHFYWDFDRYYMAGNEAGHYISQYLKDFPNEFDTDNDDIYNRFACTKTINYVSAPTENIQARYAAKWLRDNKDRINDGRQTAVVLCNEGLLQTVIHCLPNEVGQVNVTTGYPLSQTPVAALLVQLIELQVNGYDASRNRFRLHQTNSVLRHPYVSNLTEAIPQLMQTLNQRKIYYPSQEQLHVDDVTTLLFKPVASNTQQLTSWLLDVLQTVAKKTSTADPLFQESVFRAYTLLNRLSGLINDGDLQVDIITLQRLITQLIQTTSVPFHGEPAEGLQVMGVLETRNLDFRHVLLLSCTEGNMPKGVSDTSFIPYSIRKAYGLTTIDHKVAIYSYYFHRLLQRADDITIVYNNATTDNQRGEMSRFLLQLMVEGKHQINYLTLQAGQTTVPFCPQAVVKSHEVMDMLMKRFSFIENSKHAENSLPKPLLTPTAINRYMRCPLQFYYAYVCGLREPDINDDDIIDNRIFGNIFHEASRLVYTQMMQKGHAITAGDLERLLKSKVEIERAVDQAFRTELFQISDPHAPFKMELDGLQIINREVIIHYLRQLIEIDIRLAPFTVLDLEGDVVATLKTKHITTTIGGRIDRLDMITTQQGPLIRVIDYKTGASQPRPLPDVDAIFSQDHLSNHSDYYLQTFVYSLIVKARNAQVPVVPALLFIQHAGKDDYNPILKFGTAFIDDVTPHADRFKDHLHRLVDEMFDPDVPFSPTADRTRCTLCPYKQLCALASQPVKMTDGGQK